MKRLLCLALVLALLLCGCGADRNSAEVYFYYRNTDTAYFSDLGIIAPESRSVGVDRGLSGMLELYFRGPVTSELVSPFPKGLHLVKSVRTPRSVTLVLDDSITELSPVGLRVAAGCLARTVWEYDNDYKTVSIRAESKLLDGEEALVLHPEELVLADSSVERTNTLISLYFSDAHGRFLIAEERSATVEDVSQLPEYILQALLEGPKSDTLLPTVPPDTMVLGASVVDGVCVVNFSSEFVQNRPTDALGERMCVFSIVNSLCQLDEVSSVELLVEGSRLQRYSYLDLSGQLTGDETMIGPVRAGVGEFDAAVYLCIGDQEKLMEFPMRLRPSVGESQAETVLRALMDFEPRNGYFSPINGRAVLYSVSEEAGTVTVEFASNLLEHTDAQQQRCILRSIVATLRSLPSVQTVRILAGGKAVEQDDSTRWPMPDWFA